MEGTYRFRFHVQGKTSSGGRYRHVITRSRWVGVAIDPFATKVFLEFDVPAPQGIRAVRVVVTPMDAKGQLFGPFRPGRVRFSATAGKFVGEVESRLDGSYAQVLHYRAPGPEPVIKVVVDGTRLPPIRVRRPKAT